jgi:hypothetical protein
MAEDNIPLRAGNCTENPKRAIHHWHQPGEQANRIWQKKLPVWICCYCGTTIGEVFDVGSGCGPHVIAAGTVASTTPTHSQGLTES